MSAMGIYRVSRKMYLMHIPFIPRLGYYLIYLLHNSIVNYETNIGAGTVLAYGGIGVVIHKHAVIGEDCVIESNVTIGGRNNCKDLPVIGNRVMIGTGARILGNVHIGNNCIIGANAVVIHDVPEKCSVGGVPARILHNNIDITKKCNIERILRQ